MSDETETVVIFRKWRENDDIIALFPELPSDLFGQFCDAYEHVGQHGGADYRGVVQITTPATAEESAELARELARIGYQLRPLRRASSWHHQHRVKTARKLWLKSK